MAEAVITAYRPATRVPWEGRRACGVTLVMPAAETAGSKYTLRHWLQRSGLPAGVVNKSASSPPGSSSSPGCAPLHRVRFPAQPGRRSCLRRGSVGTGMEEAPPPTAGP
ncbi:hypothetical protein GCM10010398_30230 [Streptomyces fimbriatus]